MLIGWCPLNDFPTVTPAGGGFLVQSGVVEGGWFQHSLNGIQIDNQQHPFGTSGDRFVIGAEITGSSYVAMQVAEVLVYGRALSNSERTQVVDHLRAKYFDEVCSTPCLPPLVTVSPIPVGSCVGGPFDLSVAVTGTEPLSYQWRRDGITIPGATSAVYTVASATLLDAGLYDVVVSNGCGNPAVSESAAVVIEGPPVISTQPSPQLACVGGAVSLNVVAEGDLISYQWRRDGVPIVGATLPALVLNSVDGSEQGNYDVLVMSRCGTTTSNTVAVVIQTPASIMTAPTDAFLCPGGSVQLSVVPAGTPPFFTEWQKDGVTIPGATGMTLDITNAMIGDQGSYVAIVSNPCGSATSTAATVTISSGPSISASPADSFACLGGDIELTVTATGVGPLTYQWIKDGVPIAGALGSTLSLTHVTNSDAGNYTVEVTDGCSTETAPSFALSLDTLPIVTSAPEVTTACLGVAVSVAVTVDSLSPLTYQWRRNGFEIAGATAATYMINAPTFADEGLYDVVVTNSCNFITTLPVLVEVEECSAFRRGDCNTDGGFNIADVIFLLGFSFPGMTGPNALECHDACDCNDDGSLNIADAVCFLGFLFGSPPVEPAPPFGACGHDPTNNDALDCADFPCP